MADPRGVIASVLGTEVVNGERLFVVSYRPRRFIQLGDRFVKLRRVSESLALPGRRWVPAGVKEFDVELQVERYERQASAGYACVGFTGKGIHLLRLPSRLEDWRVYDELVMTAADEAGLAKG